MFRVAHPQASMSPRNSREMQAIAECFDALLADDLPQLDDLLMQRLKAVQLITVEGNRSLAQHMELIPTSSSNSTSTSEMRVAQHTQMVQLKLNPAGKDGATKTPAVTFLGIRPERRQSPPQATLVSDAKRGIPQKTGRKDRWRQSRKFSKSANGQASTNLAKSFLPENARPMAPPAKTIPLQQQAFRRAPSPSPVANRAVSQEREPVLQGTRSLVPARRGALRPPSADEASSKRVS